MKQMSTILAMLLVASHMCAQLVHENETAVVYYMPKTELVITLEYDVIEKEPGIFYQYAERYLGSTEIVVEPSTSYQLNDIQLGTSTTADLERGYKVTAQKGMNSQLLTLSKDGRLLGYGLCESIQQTVEAQQPISKIGETHYHPTVMPLLEEQFMAGSMAKMAEGAAKQIYRIRETRLNILGGDVEHVPADGEAMRLVLEELKNQEQALVALFVGNTTITHKSHTIHYSPQASVENEVVARFSQHNGIVDKDNLGGEPLYLTLNAKQQTMQLPTELSKSLPSQIYYNLPGCANVSIAFKGHTVAQTSFAVAQYGIAIPLVQDLFIGKSTPTILFNPETGNIQSIQK